MTFRIKPCRYLDDAPYLFLDITNKAAIQIYVQSPKPFQCAAAPDQRCAFAYNRKLDGLKEGDIDPQTVMFFESNAGWNAAGGRELFSAHSHSRARIVVGFADGSVQQLSRSRLETLRWDP